jgi:hypothetical protein
MKPLMNFESARSRVSLVAAWVVANERFLAGVRQLVGLEVPFGDELLVALFADEGPLSSVGSHVGF